MPRMTTAERTGITAPANGLQVYDTDTKSQWFYNGTVWVNTATAGHKWIDGVTAGDIELVQPKTATQTIKYTGGGLLNYDKIATPFFNWTLPTTNSTSVDYFTIVNSKSLNYLNSNNISNANATNGSLALERNILIVPSSETRTNRTFFGGVSLVQSTPSTTVSINAIRGHSADAYHFSSGNISTLLGSASSAFFVGASAKIQLLKFLLLEALILQLQQVILLL